MSKSYRRNNCGNYYDDEYRSCNYEDPGLDKKKLIRGEDRNKRKKDFYDDYDHIPYKEN